MIVVRYADDAVLGFEGREDAETFRKQLEERMLKFGLELRPQKTRLIEFGRFAEQNRKRRGEGKPETFDFLGITHICGKTRKGNRFAVQRKTVKKRMRSKLQALRQELRKRRQERISDTGDWLRSVVQGYFNYHAVPGNFKALQTLRREVVPDVAAGGGSCMAGGASASQSAAPHAVGTFPLDHRPLSALAANTASMARRAVCRQIPEVGAVCAKVRPYGSVRGASGNGRPYRDLFGGGGFDFVLASGYMDGLDRIATNAVFSIRWLPSLDTFRTFAV